MLLPKMVELHEEKPVVQAQLRNAFELLFGQDDGQLESVRTVSRRSILEARMTILRYCGDYEVQCMMLKMLTSEDDVLEFGNYFAPVWFRDSPETISAFHSLLCNPEDVLNFIWTLNSAEEIPFVYSMRCSLLSWNDTHLYPTKKGSMWFHMNRGTKTFTISGLDKIPTFLDKRGYAVLAGSDVEKVQVHAFEVPIGPTIQGILVCTKQGRLVLYPDPPLSEEDWNLVDKITKFIIPQESASKIDLKLQRLKLKYIDNLVDLCDLVEPDKTGEKILSVCRVSSSGDNEVKMFHEDKVKIKDAACVTLGNMPNRKGRKKNYLPQNRAQKDFSLKQTKDNDPACHLEQSYTDGTSVQMNDTTESSNTETGLGCSNRARRMTRGYKSFVKREMGIEEPLESLPLYQSPKRSRLSEKGRAKKVMHEEGERQKELTELASDSDNCFQEDSSPALKSFVCNRSCTVSIDDSLRSLSSIEGTSAYPCTSKDLETPVSTPKHDTNLGNGLENVESNELNANVNSTLEVNVACKRPCPRNGPPPAIPLNHVNECRPGRISSQPKPALECTSAEEEKHILCETTLDLPCTLSDTSVDAVQTVESVISTLLTLEETEAASQEDLVDSVDVTMEDCEVSSQNEGASNLNSAHPLQKKENEVLNKSSKGVLCQNSVNAELPQREEIETLSSNEDALDADYSDLSTP